MSRQKLTTRQVAERYSVDPDKVLAWIRAGELAAINVAEKAGGRPRYRIDPADLAAFEARRQVRPQERATRCRRRGAQTGVTEFF
jgi:excisionase family DNA binding protein